MTLASLCVALQAIGLLVILVLPFISLGALALWYIVNGKWLK